MSSTPLYAYPIDSVPENIHSCMFVCPHCNSKNRHFSNNMGVLFYTPRMCDNCGVNYTLIPFDKRPKNEF
jgi:hypothetical protein